MRKTNQRIFENLIKASIFSAPMVLIFLSSNSSFAGIFKLLCGELNVSAYETSIEPKKEWLICREDRDCKTIEIDCKCSVRRSINSKNLDDYKKYKEVECKPIEERYKNIGVGCEDPGPPPESRCVKNQCEIVDSNTEKSEDSWWSRFKFW